MLISGELCKALDEEQLGLGEIAAKAYHFGEVNNCISREDIVKLIPLIAVDRKTVGSHQVLNFLPIGQLLQCHCHEERSPNRLRSSIVSGPICLGALP